MTTRVLTPTKISAWLDCSHYLTLRIAADQGRVKPTNDYLGSYARLLMDKGVAHERDQLERLRNEGHDLVEVPTMEPNERFDQWVERVVHLLDEGHDVLYQFPLSYDGMRGVADFLIRVDTPSLFGEFSYEPVDAKLARTSARAAHVLQLCFYADALTARQGVRPAQAHLYLGSGETESISLAGVESYWHRLRGRLADLLDTEDGAPTVPKPCTHCAFCEFADHCESEWRRDDALHFIAGITSREIAYLNDAAVYTMRTLSRMHGPINGVDEPRLAYLKRQAKLQRKARPDHPPPYEKRREKTGADPERACVPAPNDGDVFLDFEGHPFWTPSEELFFLFGWYVYDEAINRWVYECLWAHTKEEEAINTAQLIHWLADRRRTHPGMHVYHYNHTERSALQRLATIHGANEDTLAELVAGGVFVDLLEIVRHAVQVGAESYGLKSIERLTGYERQHDIESGSGAVVHYESWMTDDDGEHLELIRTYNDDDVRATRAVRDWLIDGPLRGVPWRLDPIDTNDENEPLDIEILVAELMATGDPDHRLAGHLLGYWNREGRAHWAQRAPLFDLDIQARMAHPDIITELEFVGITPPTGRQTKSAAVFKFPPQTLGKPGRKWMFPTGPNSKASVNHRSIDERSGILEVILRDELDVRPPRSMVVNDWFSPRPKPDEFAAFSRRLLDGLAHPADPARLAVMRCTMPRFIDGHEPPIDGFSHDIDELAQMIIGLDESCLAIQGPPGTGKTYTGARLISALVAAGRRVAITAFSHAAIDNLVREAIEVDSSIMVMRFRSGNYPVQDNVTMVDSNGRERWDRGQHHVYAATVWNLSNNTMTNDPAFDVLIIDEAGQLGLADALAALGSARSVVLLGDPQQLPQVSLAAHPEGSGASILGHVLGTQTTIDPAQGVFLSTTRRMHPSICEFISHQMYDGRLVADESCARQSVDGEAGLRWVRADHSGCTTSSEAEAEIVHRLVRSVIGRPWFDQHGISHTMTSADVMIVAPYNDQVDLIRKVLRTDTQTADTRVGTVDRFQGQECPVVIFSMATSTPADMPRDLGFLFSRERLNVAISRARALAYVVCTESLLDARARTVEEMRLIGMLCAFVDNADHIEADQLG